jgi:hypothetical protein
LWIYKDAIGKKNIRNFCHEGAGRVSGFFFANSAVNFALFAVKDAKRRSGERSDSGVMGVEAPARRLAFGDWLTGNEQRTRNKEQRTRNLILFCLSGKRL